PAARISDAQRRPGRHADDAARSGVGFPLRSENEHRRIAHQPPALEALAVWRRGVDPHPARLRLRFAGSSPRRPVIRIVLPRLLRAASFRLAAFYVAVFAGSALVLGAAVFLEARSALEQQMKARIETEATFLRAEYRSGGLTHLLTVVRQRGEGPSALDYLVQDPAGRHLIGEMPATLRLAPG